MFPHEGNATGAIRSQVEPESILYADEASCWDSLIAHYEMKRVNHRIANRDKGADTNQAESFFSRLRRAEVGTHHHISGPYLHAYANEMAWREDTRRKANGTLNMLAAKAALDHPVSRQWKGYWQRTVALNFQ